MLQVNKGDIVYPKYDCLLTRPLFYTKDEFDKYVNNFNVYQFNINVRYYIVVKLEQKISAMLTDKTIVESEVNSITEHVTRLFIDELENHRCSEETATTNSDSTTDTTSDDTTSVTTDTTTVTTTVATEKLSNVIDLTVDDEDCMIKYKCSCSNTFWKLFTVGHICLRVLHYCIECLEKLHQYDRATKLLELCLSQTIYGKHRRGKLFERIAVNLDYHINDFNKVSNILIMLY